MVFTQGLAMVVDNELEDRVPTTMYPFGLKDSDIMLRR